MDRSIVLQRVTTSDTDSGAVVETWGNSLPLRAQLVQTSTEEFQRAFGAGTESTVVFRTRYVDDVELSDQIIYQDEAYDVKEIKEIGRRRGLELRCVKVGNG